MSLPIRVGDFWVSSVTLPVSRDGDDWYGRWWIYNRRPDLEENAGIIPMAEGATGVFADKHDADRAARREGRRRALVMTR